MQHGATRRAGPPVRQRGGVSIRIRQVFVALWRTCSRDVAPSHSVWYRNFVLPPSTQWLRAARRISISRRWALPSDLDGALEFRRIGVRVWRRLRRKERHPTTFGVVVPACHLTITAVDSGWVLCGEIDAASVSSLVAATSKIPPGRATVDIDGVSFMDSSGLRVLVEASVRAKHDGGSLVLLNPQNAIRRLITLSGLSGYLELSDRATVGHLLSRVMICITCLAASAERNQRWMNFGSGT